MGLSTTSVESSSFMPSWRRTWKAPFEDVGAGKPSWPSCAKGPPKPVSMAKGFSVSVDAMPQRLKGPLLMTLFWPSWRVGRGKVWRFGGIKDGAKGWNARRRGVAPGGHRERGRNQACLEWYGWCGVLGGLSSVGERGVEVFRERR